MYYGDEVGIGKVEIPPEAAQDPWEKNEPGLGLGRDPERTPMHWDGSDQGGFTSGKPWLPLDPRCRSSHVEGLRDDPASILMLYRRLIQLRRRHPALSVGGYTQVTAEGNVLAYERQHGSERFLVALNMGSEPHALSLPAGSRGRVVLSTLPDRGEEPIGAEINLRADEGLIIALGT